ncbi:hypothetical protein GXP67_15125 [Rhodocytophaga rosea]|uniref:Uncharacterized protein n=1 Tax=Rhodocytophaga rosea TaxID=2704465 RepID=A0A6C0GIK8_9BACT|nr:hypothetical protein [Rhodocytophaga rosea]QHT67876.1 hypothetical protein GXP67_15125 [Rhodocytophaga rosea]
MSKLGIGLVIAFLLILTSLGICFSIFKATGWFLSNIDGNKANINYTSIVKEYSLLRTENSVCLKSINGYKRIIPNVDSLNWNDTIITGYSKQQYFKIHTATHEIKYFTAKTNLIKSIYIVPHLTLNEVPGMR